ncbi:ribbon-helix-helix domain-containing protein [Falsochrobactrum ovis]|uniref:Putative DNA-binding ribbon-helix-helix protein n=1 Tax=Falsochrobactrum ovis TaxID=1293442 RepID=A0A364JXY9_9HYPH|nr:ribbon-helix-helix domain-containing protein [Falsochrobactrum ovis]RAK32160.1 putative DNA-binding ribbon-helix-helix protein [Falsochrobactrum ovis]
MTSSARLKKRSVSIRGHATSYTLEEPFYQIIQDIARMRGLSVSALISEIDGQREKSINLSSALRLYALNWVKSQLADQGE